MEKSNESYRSKIITFGLYLGYDETGKKLKQRLIDHCKTINKKPSSYIRELIEQSLPKNVDNS